MDDCDLAFRIFLPRRKQFLLNTILLAILLILLAYVWIRERRWQLVTLPPGEGRTWPSEMNSSYGELGAGVVLNAEEERIGKKQMNMWFMNLVASDKIPFNRTLPDVRMAECRDLVYDKLHLPKASVIVIFTDEAWSPLLRTVHSIIDRSPPELLAEVLLVDDYSQRKNFTIDLDAYLKRFGKVVRLIRLKQREGLIRAKLFGAKNAKGEVIVFLDSHCEVNVGWLEPMLQRIHEKRSAIVCPIIDPISAWDFSYSGSAQVSMIGGFWWSLHFRWDHIRPDVLRARISKTDAIPSPTMAGGLLAADRKFFLEVGGYDPGMDIWGGENLEISFRVWMCGGSIEFIPCSHVGHVFRDGHPYNMTGPGGNLDVHGTNSKRLAEVWMDDYKRLYYAHRRDLVDKNVGDLSERIALRKRLNCKNFRWYLENVIPDKFVPDENVLGYGAFRNPKSEFCLDTLQQDEKKKIPISVFFCQPAGSQAQLFSLTKSGQFRRELNCARVEIVSRTDVNASRRAVLGPCSSSASDQKWEWNNENGLMRNVESNLCMDLSQVKSKSNVLMRNCDAENAFQKWEFVLY